MTSERHENAIAIIKESLQEEFKDQIEIIHTNGSAHDRMPYRPDIWIWLKNEKFVIVEVGFTQPEKILAYIKDSRVDEFRWYTKEPKLVWAIKKRNPAHGVKLLNDHEIEQMMTRNPLYDSWVTCCCPTCGEFFRAREGQLFSYGSGRVKYLVCPKCDHFDGPTGNQR